MSKLWGVEQKGGCSLGGVKRQVPTTTGEGVTDRTVLLRVSTCAPSGCFNGAHHDDGEKPHDGLRDDELDGAALALAQQLHGAGLGVEAAAGARGNERRAALDLGHAVGLAAAILEDENHECIDDKGLVAVTDCLRSGQVQGARVRSVKVLMDDIAKGAPRVRNTQRRTARGRLLRPGDHR